MTPLFPTPAEMVRLGTLWWRLALESQAVIGYRLAGLPQAGSPEMARAIAEKPWAFVEAAIAGSQAVLAGRRADQIAEAALTPLRVRTRANESRLSRRRR